MFVCSFKLIVSVSFVVFLVRAFLLLLYILGLAALRIFGGLLETKYFYFFSVLGDTRFAYPLP